MVSAGVLLVDLERQVTQNNRPPYPKVTQNLIESNP